MPAARRPRFLVGLLAAALLATNLAVVSAVTRTPAAADTAPVDPTLPETVSAAALPTVQINGVVWAQVIVGNRVYATGQFTQARPAGAAAGTNETPRSNILAFDLTTGNLITDWAPSLNAQGLALAASADGSTIYVGGDFDQVNGQWRSRIAALDAQTGALKPFNPGANTTVRAIALNAATNTVYYGGFFTSVGNTDIGSTARSRLAAVDATSGALKPWAPATDREVVAMVVHPASGRLIIAGNFNTLNGVQAWGSASVDGQSGASMPWAANTVVQNHDSGSEVSSLATDGQKIYGTGWAFFAGGANANFEGVFAADPLTGAVDWIDGGRGDNYDVAVGSGVVYSVGHPHDWGMLDWNPQYPDPWQFQRTVAIDSRRSPTLYNAYGTPDEWQPFRGMPAAQPLHWLPTLTGGTYTGQGQAAWSVATNGDYVVEGGEFPRVNNTPQQGLVRFAKRALSPSVDQIQNFTELTPTLTAQGPGSVRVAWTAAWDRDNAALKVEVLRGDTTATSTVLRTFTTQTTWWNRPPLGFVDTTAPPGTTQTYRIRVTDPFGNGFAGPPASITVPSGTPVASPYTASVGADNPDWFWRMGEASGRTASDRAGSNDLTLGSSVSRNQSSALLNEPSDRSVTFPSTTSTSTVQGASPYWQPGPQRFSLEAWVKTSTSSGGKIIGFGNSRTGRSSSDGNDRVLYMTNTGQLRFGVRPDMGTRITVNSTGTYRDNQWHHVVGTLGPNGMNLYVDGNLVASNPSVTKAQTYRGYWRVGGDRLSSWPSTPSNEAINAGIDEVAVYPTALTLGRIRAHYLASGRTGSFGNIAPTAAFTSTSSYLTASFNGTASTDDDGTIVSYAWTFGDGGTSTGATPQHTYAAAGSYTATLTVTDDRGGTNSTSRSVVVTDPPPNILPTASFTSTSTYRTATFAATATDEDGTIASYAWDFGDGGTGIGANPQHTYAAAGTYPVTLTVTDDRGGTATTTVNVTLTDQYAADTFERAVANGLGTADTGGPWSLSGAASSFAVSGGAARITGVVGGNRSAYLASARQPDVNLRAKVGLGTASTGGGAYVSLIGRRASNGNDYRLKLRYLSDGSVAAYLVSTVGNVENVLASTTVPGLTVTGTDQLRLRFTVQGSPTTTVRAKVWRAGAPEPAAWLLTNTAATPAALQTSGDIGALVYVSGSWTGPAPTVAIDDLVADGDFGAPANQPPVASFTSTPSYLTASFDASASADTDGGTITSYAWSFGDGGTGSGATPQHTYAAPGTYPVTLTVTDDGGASAIATGSVTVSSAPPPTAAFVTDADHLVVAFDASGSSDADGAIVAYDWSFGDGFTGTGVTPQHTYAAPGTYTVTLTVTDDDGNTGTASATVTVSSAPAVYAADAFGRTVANGFGTADVGGAWTLSGTASSFAVDGTVGRITGAVAANRAAYLASVRQVDVDMTGSVSLDRPATGGGAYVSLIGRRVSNGNDYRLKLRYLSNGTVSAALVRTLGGVETTVGSVTVPGLTVGAGDVLKVRFQVEGTTTTTLRARVWKATAAEPATWTVTGTDATPAALQVAGDTGLLLYLSGSWTGAVPTLSVDDLAVGAVPTG